MFEDSDVGFIELENGYILTETIMSPHGTGMAGLNYYESLESFEESCGTDYKRIKNKTKTSCLVKKFSIEFESLYETE